MAHIVFVTLVAMLPYVNHAACVRTRAAAIETAAARGEGRGVPPSVLLVVGLLESHWGCHPASGGCWGAPRDAHHRSLAGTPDHAARALARSYAVCGDWRGAVSRFRSGLCRARQPAHRAYVRRAASLIAAIHARTGLPRPYGF